MSLVTFMSGIVSVSVGRDPPLAQWGHRGEYAGPDAGSGIHDHEGR